MAGDWIKMQTCLPDKPEVWQIASIVRIDPDAVIGKLLRVWAWFDTHTEDGNAVGVTFALVDRISGVTGFAEAMSLCGWLEQRDINLTLPKFSRHNGSSAKTRALTNDRVAKTRNNKGKSNAECNADIVTKTVTREEKRREEETPSVSHDKIVFDGSAFQNINGQQAIWESAYPAIDIRVEINKAAAWLVANPKNKKSNYARFLTSWLSRAQDKAPKASTAKPAPPGWTPPKTGDTRTHPTNGASERFIEGTGWVLAA